MGCALSGQQVYPEKTKSVDPRLSFPLTEREVFIITKSWKTIGRNMEHTGVAMFSKMFEGSKMVKAMFEQFRSVGTEELYTSRTLENHALLVMNALDEAITSLDDPEYIIEMLLTTGKSHRRFEDFEPDIFWNIEEPFVQAVRETLMERFTPAIEKVYRKTIKFVLSTLIIGFHPDDPTRPASQASSANCISESAT